MDASADLDMPAFLKRNADNSIPDLPLRSGDSQSDLFFNGKIRLVSDECLTAMDGLAENSFDSCVTDPPYHLQSITRRFAKSGRTESTRTTSGPHQRTANGFMGQQWDGGDVAFRVETWEKILRVLKPGAYLVAFSSTRTFGRMSVAIEDAGFIVHPFIAWIFGQGFPKAHRVVASGLSDLDRETNGWDGWHYGTQSLKPAIEPIFVGQKPFDGGLTGTQNIIKWGTGALNIDAARIHGEGSEARTYTVARTAPGAVQNATGTRKLEGVVYQGMTKAGRWPANVIHDGSAEVIDAFPAEAGAFAPVKGTEPSNSTVNVYGARDRVATLHHGDSGSAARFFYSAKADADDRIGSSHPTVKPVDLMQYLVRLVTPPSGVILDPFAGTGTTGEAAFREGMRATLIEREAAYQADIRRRMKLCLAGPDERARESIKAKQAGKPIDCGPLFGGEVSA